MSAKTDEPQRPDDLLAAPHLADALESDRFKQFLDHAPVAIAVSDLRPAERITYANIEFERLTGQAVGDIQGQPWSAVAGRPSTDDGQPLSDAITRNEDYIGAFTFEHAGGPVEVDVWSNIIQDDAGSPIVRRVALAEIGQRPPTDKEQLEQQVRDKDVLLRELQHRVKNNLQMITALIRLESRNLPHDGVGERFDRLAGRINALALLYRSLSDGPADDTVDLGVYLSQIASGVMAAHAPPGIHLDLQVDTWPASVNVAMPAGLVVNEVLTNALKHAFVGREGGSILLHSLVEGAGCRVIIADDGVGLSEGDVWPQTGRLSALIVQSLRQNAHARVDVTSEPGKGMRVTIFFARADAAPDASI